MWKAFMPRRHEISHQNSEDLYSMQIYTGGLNALQFNPQTSFLRRAAMVVSNYENVPEGMLRFDHPGGLYAVFMHHGPASEFGKTAAFIFGEWIPKSKYEVDDRPHFEILDKRYLGPDHPDSVEEVWIPLREKV
jgi:AraC family transcriptional regulator